MKNCPICGKQFADTEKHCPFCNETPPENTEIASFKQDELTHPLMNTDESINIVKTPTEEASSPVVPTINLDVIAFDGRMGRKAFILRWLPLALITLGLSFQVSLVKSTPIVISLYLIIVPFIIIGIGYKMRRLRDTGLEQWKIIICVILSLFPVLDSLIACYMLIKKSKYD